MGPNGDGIVANGLGLALFVDCDGSRFDGGLPLPFGGTMLGSFGPNDGIFDPGGGTLGLATRGNGFGGSNVPAVGAIGNGDAGARVSAGFTMLGGGGVERGAFGGKDVTGSVGRGDFLNAVGAS